MAITTYKVFLMKKGTSAFEKLIDIKDYPDLGGAPEMIETTTLSNGNRTYKPGIQNSDALVFTANYDKDDYETLAALAGQDNEYAVWFGGTESGGTLTPTGDAGMQSFAEESCACAGQEDHRRYKTPSTVHSWVRFSLRRTP